MYGDKTVLDLVEAGLQKNTTGVSLATKREGKWRTTSTEEFTEKVRRFALGLYDLGVRKGDRVALHSENGAEWIIADQAILSLGAVNVPIYTTQPPDQIRYILENAEARIYVVSTEALFSGLAPHLGEVTSLLHTIGIRGVFHPEMLAFDAVLERGAALDAREPERFESLRAAVKPDDLASFVYTSGTTGVPKGVMLTHRNFASNVLASIDRSPFDIEGLRGANVLSYLPLSHSFERMVSYLYLYIGYPIWFIENHREILEDCKTVKPVHFTTVPRLLEKVYAGIHERAAAAKGLTGALMRWAVRLADGYDVREGTERRQTFAFRLAERAVFSRLRMIFGGRLVAITSGGAALAPEIMNFMNAIGIVCGQGYGLTETSPVIAVYDPKDLRAGSVGKPITGVDVRLDDDGEILVRGPNVMKGYFKLPEATREVFTEDGWFRTGDIGRFDEDGFLYITDRKKALMKLSTGKYVAPQNVEMRLGSRTFIEQAMVIGNDRKFCSALIVPDYEAVRRQYGEDATADAIHDLIREEVERVNRELPPWEQVKKFAVLDRPFTIDSGEITPTLKLKRRVILEKHRETIEAMYTEAERARV